MKQITATNDTFIPPSEMETSVPIVIRPDTVVRFIGLPHDLTEQEAEKIANVIKALVGCWEWP